MSFAHILTLWRTSHNCLNSSQRQNQSQVILRPTVSRPVCLGIKHPSMGLKTRSLLLSNSCRLVDVERSLWREDGSVVCQSDCQQSVSRPGRFCLGIDPQVLIVEEAEWAPEPVLTLWCWGKCLAPDVNRTRAAKSVTRRYTDWCIPAVPFLFTNHNNIWRHLLGSMTIK
jgi:hypothetical protein